MPRLRLAVVDLDGTLLDSNKKISDRNQRALKRLTGLGVHLAIATGRRFSALRPYLEALELAEAPWVICNSGAFVKRGLEGPPLRRRLFARELAEEALRLARDHDVAPLVHEGPHAETLLLAEGDRSGRHLARYLGEASPRPDTLADLNLARDPVQLTFAASIAANRQLEQSLKNALSGQILTLRTEYPRPSELSLLDVLHPEASKRAAVSWLMKELGVDGAELLVLGDNWNDLDMLELAAERGHAVVMANAVAELRDRFETTASNDDSGVAQVIERWIPESRDRG